MTDYRLDSEEDLEVFLKGRRGWFLGSERSLLFMILGQLPLWPAHSNYTLAKRSIIGHLVPQLLYYALQQVHHLTLLPLAGSSTLQDGSA
jgi:hypothetical protein